MSYARGEFYIALATVMLRWAASFSPLADFAES